MIMPRDSTMLQNNATYYTLTRAMHQDLLDMKNDRVMRQKLQNLVQAGLLNRCRMQVANPDNEAPTPVYYPSRKGLEALVGLTGCESWLNCCTQTPNWQHLVHWLEVARFHIMLNRAVTLRPDVTVGGWFGEWDVVNPDERSPEKRFRLYKLLAEKPKLVCNPDAAFLLCQGTRRKISYVEIDRETSGINQIAKSKTPGFAAVAEKELHRRDFDTTSKTFWVLSVSPTPGRRDLLRKAVAKEALPDLWRFAAKTELTPETLLSTRVWYPCEGEPGALVNPPQEAIEGHPNGVPEGVPDVLQHTGVK